MSNYDELVEFRNKLTNDNDCVIFEEDCQLLDRILDDLEQKDKRIAELDAVMPKFKPKDKIYFIEYDGYYIIKASKVIANNRYIIDTDMFPYVTYRNESQLFATLTEAEEALKKLEEV